MRTRPGLSKGVKRTMPEKVSGVMLGALLVVLSYDPTTCWSVCVEVVFTMRRESWMAQEDTRFCKNSTQFLDKCGSRRREGSTRPDRRGQLFGEKIQVLPRLWCVASIPKRTHSHQKRRLTGRSAGCLEFSRRRIPSACCSPDRRKCRTGDGSSCTLPDNPTFPAKRGFRGRDVSPQREQGAAHGVLTWNCGYSLDILISVEFEETENRMEKKRKGMRLLGESAGELGELTGGLQRRYRSGLEQHQKKDHHSKNIQHQGFAGRHRPNY